MRAYYINVASRTDRRDAMEARLLAVGVSAQRIDAVTDSDVRPEQRARYCDPTARRWTSVRELTCSLSHIKAMLAFLATDEEHAVIFEDDVLLSSALAQFLDEFERSPHGVDLLRLETDNSRLRVPPAAERSLNQFGLFKLFSAAGGAAGYIVSRKAATHITSSEEIFFRPTDQALFDPYGAISRIIVTLQLIPALCIQEDRLTSSAERLVSSDLESARLNRDKIDKSNFWRRSVFNLQDFVTRDIALPARNAWLKVRYDIAKRDIPFLDT